MVTSANSTDALLGNCSVLLDNSSAYLPYPSALVRSNFSLLPNTSQLMQLSNQVEQILDLNSSSLVEESRDGYQAFLLLLVSESLHSCNKTVKERWKLVTKCSSSKENGVFSQGT